MPAKPDHFGSRNVLWVIPACRERRTLTANTDKRDSETFLGVTFLASEYSTGKTHRGRIDCPVIIEYKRMNRNIDLFRYQKFGTDLLALQLVPSNEQCGLERRRGP